MSRARNVQVVLLVLAMVTLSLSVSAQGAAPKVKYRTFSPPHMHVRLDLPTTWHLSESTATHYVAYDPTVRSATPGVFPTVDIETVAAPATSFDSFAAAEIASIRENDLGMDPHAVIRSRKIRLPAGQAVMVTHTLHQNVDGKTVVFKGIVYGLQHNGTVYAFSYSVQAQKFTSEASVFQHSASTIRFS